MIKMKVYSTLDKFFEEETSDFGIVIGNFDGVHRGHQNLLQHFIEQCDDKKLKKVVYTFRNHPLHFFKGDEYPHLISNEEFRIQEFKKLGVDIIIMREFDSSLQGLSAKEFLLQIVTDKKFKYIHLGHDFKLGAGKEDSIKLLRQFQTKYQFSIYQESSFIHNNEVLSSTLIREKITTGKIEDANELLGHSFMLEGIVQKGKGLGKTELVATANIEVPAKYILPKNGVYYTWLEVDDKKYESITNIGVNPSVDQRTSVIIESHILFEQIDLYDRKIKISFCKFLRAEVKFDSLGELKNQILKDVDNAKKYFRKNSSIKLALIGKDISHSKSQMMYESILKKAVNYTLLDYKSELLIPKLSELKEKFIGVSITAPYKKHFLDEVENLSSFGAINAVDLRGEKFRAINTDLMAIERLWERFENISEIYLIGSGAMAELFIHFFKKKQIAYIQFSRKLDNLDQLSQVKGKSQSCLVINCCSRDYIFDKALLEGSYNFWDMNYSFESHEKQFSNTNVRYIDGLSLLKLQAKFAASFWNLITD